MIHAVLAREAQTPRLPVFLKLFILFVTVPLVELALLLLLSQYVLGWLPTLLLVICTGIGGAWLAQRQGIQAIGRIRRDLAAGRMPADSVTDAVLIFVAGLLLMTPGVLSDLTGILLLIPASRLVAKYWLFRWFKSHFQLPTLRTSPMERAASGEVIDSYTVMSNDREDVA
jgi:UPF0716 protein FxsA